MLCGCAWWYVHPPFDAEGVGVVVRARLAAGWGGGVVARPPPLGKRRGGVVVTPRRLKQLTPGYGELSVSGLSGLSDKCHIGYGTFWVPATD